LLHHAAFGDGGRVRRFAAIRGYDPAETVRLGRRTAAHLAGFTYAGIGVGRPADLDAAARRMAGPEEMNGAGREVTEPKVPDDLTN